MSLRYLLDENVEPSYKTQLARRNFEIIMWVVGEPSAPDRGTLDPEILLWCEEYGFALVTNNRASMPVHLREHVKEGRHVPGIFRYCGVINWGVLPPIFPQPPEINDFTPLPSPCSQLQAPCSEGTIS